MCFCQGLITKVTAPNLISRMSLTQSQYHQSLIGVLRWICKLGRVDILVAISMPLRYLMLPREGHLQQVFHLSPNLKHRKRSRIVFDDTEPIFDASAFKTCDWSELYPEAEEPLPPMMPQEQEHGVATSCFINADHAGCKATRRSCWRIPLCQQGTYSFGTLSGRIRLRLQLLDLSTAQ